MHKSSLDKMTELLGRVAKPGLSVMDVGSLDVNGTYRPLVEGLGMSYEGVDMRKGPNVDRVVDITEGRWHYAKDIVISGQMLEHCADPFRALSNMRHSLAPGGWCICIVPWKQDQHDHPHDYWRVLPDGMRILMMEAHFTDVRVGMQDGSCGVGDCWGMGRNEREDE